MATHLIVADAETHHVHTHIRWRLIWVLAIDTFEECVEHGENLNVTVVVDRHLTIRIEMEGVNHIHIIEVGSRSLVSDVHGVFQWQAPHRESLKLGISSTNATLVFAIKLAQTYRHLTTTWTWRRDNHQRTGCLHIIILSEPLVRGNQLYIMRIAINQIVAIGLDAHTFQTVTELVSGTLSIIMSDNH